MRFVIFQVQPHLTFIWPSFDLHLVNLPVTWSPWCNLGIIINIYKIKYFRPPLEGEQAAEGGLGDKEFISAWIMSWSIACFSISVITCITFAIQPIKVDYPERPILFLSCCYLFMSIGYGIRFVIGHEKMSCDKTGPDELIHSVSPGEGSLACFFRNGFDQWFSHKWRRVDN